MELVTHQLVLENHKIILLKDLPLGWYIPNLENVQYYEINIIETQINSLKYFPRRSEDPSSYLYLKSNIEQMKKEVNSFYSDWKENEKYYDNHNHRLFHIPFSIENNEEQNTNRAFLNPIDKNDPDNEFIQNGFYCLVLILSNNRLNSLEELNIFCDLRLIDLSNNYIKDIHQIIECPFLQSINMNYNRIEDISCLKELIYLNEIHFSHNKIKKYKCENDDLEIIDLSYNDIDELEIMNRTLKVLDISYNPVLRHNICLKNLLDCVNIKELHLSGINEYIIKEEETGMTESGITLLEVLNELLSKLKGLISFEIDSDKTDYTFPKHMKYLNGFNFV